jgi:hypothetical protein
LEARIPKDTSPCKTGDDSLSTNCMEGSVSYLEILFVVFIATTAVLFLARVVANRIARLFIALDELN